MNQPTSTSSSLSSSSPTGGEAVSRRAYELWEKEGRPDGSDLRHWLQAEQDLAGMPVTDHGDTSLNAVGGTSTLRNTGADTRPLQGTGMRAAPAVPAGNRDTRRGPGSRSPFGEKTSSSQPAAVRRKPSSTPIL